MFSEQKTPRTSRQDVCEGVSWRADARIKGVKRQERMNKSKILMGKPQMKFSVGFHISNEPWYRRLNESRWRRKKKIHRRIQWKGFNIYFTFIFLWLWECLDFFAFFLKIRTCASSYNFLPAVSGIFVSCISQRDSRVCFMYRMLKENKREEKILRSRTFSIESSKQ